MKYSEDAMQEVRERRLIIDQVDSWLYEIIEPYLGQRILEIGCGMGNFAHHFLDRDLYVGIDMSQESVDFVNEKYQHYPNMHAYQFDVTSSELANLSNFNFDTVISVNVFEHLEDDVSALGNVRNLLSGGTIILIVPAHEWLYGPMDSSIGHYRRYTKKKMTRLLTLQRLDCVMQKYVNSLGALGWFVNGKIFRQTIPPSGQLRLLNRIIPVVKRMETSFSTPFGVSLVTIAKDK